MSEYIDHNVTGDIKVGQGGAEALFNYTVDIGKKVDKIHRKLVTAQPIIKTVGGSGVLVTGAITPVPINELPSRGRIWNILKAVLTSTDGHTTLTGVTVDLYAGTNVDPYNPTLFNLVQGNITVPSVFYWSKQVEWCQSGEQIIALCYGGTNGQVVNLSVRVADYAVPTAEAMHV